MSNNLEYITNYDLLKEVERRKQIRTLTIRHKNRYDSNGEIFTEVSLLDNNDSNGLSVLLSKVY